MNSAYIDYVHSLSPENEKYELTVQLARKNNENVKLLLLRGTPITLNNIIKYYKIMNIEIQDLFATRLSIMMQEEMIKIGKTDLPVEILEKIIEDNDFDKIMISSDSYTSGYINPLLVELTCKIVYNRANLRRLKSDNITLDYTGDHLCSYNVSKLTINGCVQKITGKCIKLKMLHKDEEKASRITPTTFMELKNLQKLVLFRIDANALYLPNLVKELKLIKCDIPIIHGDVTNVFYDGPYFAKFDGIIDRLTLKVRPIKSLSITEIPKYDNVNTIIICDETMMYFDNIMLTLSIANIKPRNIILDCDDINPVKLNKWKKLLPMIEN